MVDLSSLEEDSTNVPWSGRDEEITKQTGGFTREQNLLEGAKQKTTAEARREEENMGLFQIVKRI